MENSKQHWERVYETRQPAELSWTQEFPAASLQCIKRFPVDRAARIIDIGGGDSKLVDYLLTEGFQNITVLDISEKALVRARKRLEGKAKSVNWIVGDVTTFDPPQEYDIWHDRATFHFLTSASLVNDYIAIAAKAVNGYMVIGGFSELGPEKCSGLPVQQYNEKELAALLNAEFEKIECFTEDHITPFKTKQHFLFCSFSKRK